jgi:hypothetical protein
VFHADQVQGRNVVKGGSSRLAMCLHDDIGQSAAGSRSMRFLDAPASRAISIRQWSSDNEIKLA